MNLQTQKKKLLIIVFYPLVQNKATHTHQILENTAYRNDILYIYI